MRKEIYLFTTIKEGSRNRLRPMPFQKGKAGLAANVAHGQDLDAHE